MGAQYVLLDRKAIVDSNLTFMIAEGPSVVADHAFTTGQIPLSSFEKPLAPTRMKAGINDGWGVQSRRCILVATAIIEAQTRSKTAT
jgi:hypothetical protein